jgi:hypothetical protein
VGERFKPYSSLSFVRMAFSQMTLVGKDDKKNIGIENRKGSPAEV